MVENEIFPVVFKLINVQDMDIRAKHINHDILDFFTILLPQIISNSTSARLRIS